MVDISVIIPVYNTVDYLRKCVDSVLCQTLPPAEVILIDDGSTDSSSDICDVLAKEYPDQILVIHTPNGGPSSARNRGLDVARGSYIAFIDSDDYLEIDAFKWLYELMEKYDADMSIGEMMVDYPDGRSYCHVSGDFEVCWNTEEAMIQLCSYHYLHASSCTALYCRALFDGLRFPLDKYCEDYYIQHQVFARCRRVAYSTRPFYHYVQRPQSRSRSKYVSLAPIDASNKRVEFYRNNFPSIVWAAETDCAIANMSVYTQYIRNEVSCDPLLLRKLQQTSRRYVKTILTNKYLPFAKKAQVLMFCRCLWLYRWVISRTDHR